MAIVQVDFEKAFDNSDHRFLFAVLEQVCLGDVLTRGIKLCYSGVSTQIIVKYLLCRTIPVERLVGKSCPSPILFGVYLKNFWVNIIKCESLRRLSVSTCEVNVMGYADDMVLICADRPRVLSATGIVGEFCCVLRATFNMTN